MRVLRAIPPYARFEETALAARHPAGTVLSLALPSSEHLLADIAVEARDAAPAVALVAHSVRPEASILPIADYALTMGIPVLPREAVVHPQQALREALTEPAVLFHGLTHWLRFAAGVADMRLAHSFADVATEALQRWSMAPPPERRQRSGRVHGSRYRSAHRFDAQRTESGLQKEPAASARPLEGARTASRAVARDATRCPLASHGTRCDLRLRRPAGHGSGIPQSPWRSALASAQ